MSSVIGIDFGSRTTNFALMVDGEIRRTDQFLTGHNPLPEIEKKLVDFGDSIIAATGYGRHLLEDKFGASCVTEIRACARGAHELFPDCRVVLDVGGQDCKVVELNESGRVKDFKMNDRCAAGTGKFVEVMAQTFGLDIEEFIKIAISATRSVSISSMCTVFAESEVVSLITSGHAKDEIAFGLHKSISDRLIAMLSTVPKNGDLVFLGGGALNNCLHVILQDHLKKEILRPSDPQIVTAMGAALCASDSI